MRKIEIKISGSGTLDQVAGRLLDVVREIQTVNVYGGEIPKIFEDNILYAEITEE